MVLEQTTEGSLSAGPILGKGILGPLRVVVGLPLECWRFRPVRQFCASALGAAPGATLTSA
mgnify:CR=1 FL=1